MAVLLIVAGFPALTFAAAQRDVHGWAARLCGFLGVLSYAVYVVHQPAAVLFDRVFRRLVGPVEHFAPAAGWVFVVALVLGCRLLDSWYDRPVRRWLAGRFGRF